MKCVNVAFSVVPGIGEGNAGKVNKSLISILSLVFRLSLAPYAVYSTQIYLQHIAQPVKSERPMIVMFICAFVRPSVCSFWMFGHNKLQPVGPSIKKNVCCTPAYPLLTPYPKLFWHFWKIILFFAPKYFHQQITIFPLWRNERKTKIWKNIFLRMALGQISEI